LKPDLPVMQKFGARGVTQMAESRNDNAKYDRRLAEVARSLHRASERLWARVANPDKYEILPETLDELQKLTTGVSRALTKLKLKANTKQ